MADPVLPGLRRIVCAGRLTTQERWSNTFYADDNVPLTQSRADQIAAEFAQFYSGFADLISTAWQFSECTVYDRSEVDGESRDAVFSPVTGTDTEATFQQIAIVLSWGTTNPGKKFRGRTYLAGIATTAFTRVDSVSPLLLGVTSQEAIVDAAVLLHSELFGLGIILGVFSRVPPGAFTAFTSARVGTVPDTMRSRRDNLIESYVSAPLP